MKPTFVGIGAQKCASTWMFDILADHPDVAVSGRKKEVDFFSKYYDFGFQWYENHFSRQDGASAIGEVSPSYFTEADVPMRISRYIADAKILVSLRHPIERAISHHKHEIREGHFVGPDFSFEAGMRNNPMYVEQSMYAAHLTRWLRFFPRERIHVVFLDDIKANAAGVAHGIYGFLGIGTDHRSLSLHEKSNASYAVRSHAMERLVRSSRDAITQAGGRKLWNALGAAGLRALYNKGNRMPAERIIPDPLPETISHLQQTFGPDIDQLETLLDRNIAQWRRWKKV